MGAHSSNHHFYFIADRAIQNLFFGQVTSHKSENGNNGNKKNTEQKNRSNLKKN